MGTFESRFGLKSGAMPLEQTSQGRPAVPEKKNGWFADELRQTRKARNESQRRFWSRFGVTQSRGSRFELGGDIPSPVAILLKLYFDGIISDGDLWRARRKRYAKTSATD